MRHHSKVDMPDGIFRRARDTKVPGGSGNASPVNGHGTNNPERSTTWPRLALATPGGLPGAQHDPAEVAPGGYQVDGLGDLFQREVELEALACASRGSPEWESRVGPPRS